MSTLKAGPILLLFLASFAMQGRAATVIAAGANTVEACSFAVNPATEIVRHLPYPADWKVVVVCNENVWDMLMRQDRINFISNYAFTFQPNLVTFIRAKVFLEPMNYTPEQVLKHELGHIVCQCDDEEVAWNGLRHHRRGLVREKATLLATNALVVVHSRVVGHSETTLGASPERSRLLAMAVFAVVR